MRPIRFRFAYKLNLLAAPWAEVNLTRTLSSDARTSWKDADRPGAIHSVNKCAETKLELLTTGFDRRPRGSLHPAIRSQCEPLLRSVFFNDASIAGARAVLEFLDASRSSRQMQFFVVMIGVTLKRFPSRRQVAGRLVSHFTTTNEIVGLGTGTMRRLAHPKCGIQDR